MGGQAGAHRRGVPAGRQFALAATRAGLTPARVPPATEVSVAAG